MKNLALRQNERYSERAVYTRIRRLVVLLLFGSPCYPLLSQIPSAPPVSEIVRRSAEATHADWERAPNYDFCQTDVAGSHTRTRAELMIDGSSYERLVAIDGRPLPAQEEQAAAARYAAVAEQRSHETEEQHAKRVAQYQKERHRDQMLLEEMGSAMEFHLDGVATVNNRQTFVLRATPRPGYVPNGLETQVLTGMRGTLWVDQETFRWVRVEAEVMHPVNIVGFVARVERGTRFLLEEAPVGEDVWMASRFTMRARAKILFIFSSSSAEDDIWFGYRPRGTLQAAACIPGNPQEPLSSGQR
ncbi:MAG: hypothetical protein WCC27_22360 [Acidobacteriaceae bacterium]